METVRRTLYRPTVPVRVSRVSRMSRVRIRVSVRVLGFGTGFSNCSI